MLSVSEQELAAAWTLTLFTEETLNRPWTFEQELSHSIQAKLQHQTKSSIRKQQHATAKTRQCAAWAMRGHQRERRWRGQTKRWRRLHGMAARENRICWKQRGSSYDRYHVHHILMRTFCTSSTQEHVEGQVTEKWQFSLFERRPL